MRLPSSLRCCFLAVAAVSAMTGADLQAADPFQDEVRPFAEKYCNACHSKTKPRGELDLTGYHSAREVTADFRRWSHVIEFIRGGEMPPEDEPQPTLEERNKVVGALEAILLEEAKKHAGDPGVILPRRLSNTEYDHSIRDLIGIDVRPTRDFPVDPAGGEGFDNTGESLGMTPSLVRKYLAAAQHVADHLVLKTSGIAFAPFPVTSYSEQKKFTEQAIIDFYQRHEVRVADYLEAAWRYRHRGVADRDVDVATWAARRQLSSKYLTLVWETLNEAAGGSGYMKELGGLWDALPAPTDGTSRPSELQALERYVAFCQRKLCYREEDLIRSNAGNWPIAHLEFRARVAGQRDQFDPASLRGTQLIRVEGLRAKEDARLYLRVDPAFGEPGGAVLWKQPIFSKGNARPRNDEEAKKQEVITLREVLEKAQPEIAKRLSFGKHPDGNAIDADSFAVQAPAIVEIPLNTELARQLEGKQLLVDAELDASQKEQSLYVQWSWNKPPEQPRLGNAELLVQPQSDAATHLATSAKRICETFPNRFCYVDKDRGLAAGFHLVEGFFRDDRPLMTKVLNEQEQQELDRLWQELEFITNSTETLLRGFVWFERAERHVLHDKRFDFLRAEDPRLVEDELLTRFEKVYLQKLGVKLVDDTLQPQQPQPRFDLVHGFFEDIRAGLARQRERMKLAEQQGLADLNKLAERAYRRPLTEQDMHSLRTLYNLQRKRGQSVESALRGVFTAVLMSPDFFLHIKPSPAGPGVHPLPDHALASRLSYFLWSSLPDEELLAAAQAGKLQDEAALVAQTQRMMKDDKIEAFAREFFGQWLRYRDYLAKDAINAAAFPSYDEPLRQAMFEEPARLATHLIQEDLPITSVLDSDVTFVNGVLARHYGGEIERKYQKQSNNPAEWRQVDGLRDQGRGGLLGMGVVLTKTSKSDRTSPVKRGFWVVHHLLGQHFPPPPLDIPELPASEKEAGATIRELLTEHTKNPKCAMCHTHFDGLGLALEGFDAIGRLRTKDLAGRAIDNVAILPDGKSAEGTAGLIRYIEEHRRQDFVRTFCRKFLGYALGRSVLLSDQPLLHEMEVALQQNEYRFSVLFETVVRSPQFRQQRGLDKSASR